jgi:hypothetical protein
MAAADPTLSLVPRRRFIPAGPVRVALDVALVVWTAAWIWVGVAVALEIRGLARLSDTVGAVGRAAQQTGEALSSLDGLPLVGDRTRDSAKLIRAAGDSAIQSARESRESVDTTSVLLGISLAVIPSIPVLLLYVPQRVSLGRERRELRRALADDRDGDRALETLLARRALYTVPYHRLRAVSESPEADFEAGRHAELAAVELWRLGLRAPRRRTRRASSV